MNTKELAVEGKVKFLQLWLGQTVDFKIGDSVEYIIQTCIEKAIRDAYNDGYDNGRHDQSQESRAAASPPKELAAEAAKRADDDLGLNLAPAAATQLITIIQTCIEKAYAQGKRDAINTTEYAQGWDDHVGRSPRNSRTTR